MSAIASDPRFAGLPDDVFDGDRGRAILQERPSTASAGNHLLDDPADSPRPDDSHGFLSDILAIVLFFNPPRPK